MVCPATSNILRNSVWLFINTVCICAVYSNNIIMSCTSYFCVFVRSSYFTLYLIVIFVLSAQNECFLLMHENEFLVETVRSRPKTHSNAPTKYEFCHEIQTLFFLQPSKKEFHF
jgi:hypothetical protein